MAWAPRFPSLPALRGRLRAVGKTEVIKKGPGLAKIAEIFREIRGRQVRVGVLGDAEHGGLHQEGEELTVQEYAAVNEYGSDDGMIPPRSFLRSTFDEQRERLVEVGGKLIGAVFDGKMDVDRALGLLGADLASKVKEKITSNVPPPNRPRTVEKKGSDRTLIDTGRMLNSITWSIGESGED